MVAINIVCSVLGMAIGAIITFKILLARKSQGELLVNNTDPDGPYLFLKLKVTPYELMKKNYVTLEVKIDRTNSQK